MLVTGPSGAGKSTLFRAIAGIWPFGSGRILVPKDARLMMLPQRPYFPVGTLATAVTYPAEPGTFDRARLADAVSAVGLPALVQRLDEEAHWNRMLSLGEQQRLGIARAILQAPDFLFLDEATASLDEPSEAALYRLLHERLPGATIVSIGHRSTLVGLPSPAAHAGARRRPLSRARDRAAAGGGVRPFGLSMIASENRCPPQIKSRAGSFGIMPGRHAVARPQKDRAAACRCRPR